MTDRRTEQAGRRAPGAWSPPGSASAPNLLIEGSDNAFRGLVEDLVRFSARLQAMREAIARAVGLSPPQYRILMTVARHQGEQGIGISVAADRLGVTIPFVVTEAGRLVQLGLLEKAPNPVDRRGVLLTLTLEGRAALDRIAPLQRAINDAVFGGLSAREFATLRNLAARLAGSAERVFTQVPELRGR